MQHSGVRCFRTSNDVYLLDFRARMCVNVGIPFALSFTDTITETVRPHKHARSLNFKKRRSDSLQETDDLPVIGLPRGGNVEGRF